jgi:hypothetical protein
MLPCHFDRQNNLRYNEETKTVTITNNIPKEEIKISPIINILIHEAAILMNLLARIIIK